MEYFNTSIHARFYKHVQITAESDCWPWIGGKTKDGYGIFYINSKSTTTAHRYALEMKLGQRIERVIDASHLCNNRACVNPRHLLPESRLENMARKTDYSPGYPCVSWSDYHHKWRCYRYIAGRQKHLGYFKQEEDAESFRKQFAEALGYG